jgi:hypothetical protein
MSLPSSDEMSKRVGKHCDQMAKEIARRVMQDLGHSSHGRDIGTNVEHHARMVLLDWYLGDYIPGDQHD